MGKPVCAARDCELVIKPGMLMCRRHWFMVPKAVRDTVWATWRSGDGTAWLVASNAAIEAVFRLENSVQVIYSCTLPTHPQRGGL
jgi:hypothetical protein